MIKAPYGNANSIASGDFNRDGNLDFVVIGFSARTGRQGLSMYLGDGRGSFYEAAGSPYLTDSLMRSVTVGDVNGDGKLDLIVAHSRERTAGLVGGRSRWIFAWASDRVRRGHILRGAWRLERRRLS